MKTNEKIVAACVIGFAIIVMGFALRSGIVAFKDMDRSVTVKGLAEKEVKADKVTWPLVYKELGNDPADMYDLLTQKNKKVLAFLKSAGIKESDISVNPPVISDRQADNYSNEIMNYRYKATSVITVTSTEVDKVRTLMRRQSELMKQGIALVTEEYSGNGVVYEFTGLNKVKPDMIEEATKNARKTAQKFADDASCRLGTIRRASQGQFSVESDNYQPWIKHVRVVTTVDYLLN